MLQNELYFREYCPVCKGHNSKVFLRGNFNLQNLKPEDFRITDNRYGLIWTLYRCLNCGFVYANPLLSQECLHSFYSDLEDVEYDEEGQNREKNFNIILKRIRKLAGKTGTVLDIGAASGIFMHLAGRQGYAVAGVEPSKYLVEKAREKYGLEIFCGTLEQFRFEARYEIVTVLDLIEHLAHPDRVIAEVSAVMKKGGLLVIVTPDIHSFFARLLKKRWWHFRIAHINFFSYRNLRMLLEKSGFRVILKKRYLWHFSLYYLLTRIFKKERFNSLQNILKKINLKLPLADSLEVYAVKTED